MSARPQQEPDARRNTILGRNVKALREAAGWSQEDLAAKSGVSNVKMIESGRRKQPRVEQQRKLAAALGVPVWRLHVDRTGEVAVPQELQQLMESPIGKSVTTEEYDYLLALPSLLGRRMTYEAYWKALEMLRLTTPEPEQHDEPENDD